MENATSIWEKGVNKIDSMLLHVLFIWSLSTDVKGSVVFSLDHPSCSPTPHFSSHHSLLELSTFVFYLFIAQALSLSCDKNQIWVLKGYFSRPSQIPPILFKNLIHSLKTSYFLSSAVHSYIIYNSLVWNFFCTIFFYIISSQQPYIVIFRTNSFSLSLVYYFQFNLFPPFGATISKIILIPYRDDSTNLLSLSYAHFL